LLDLLEGTFPMPAKVKDSGPPAPAPAVGAKAVIRAMTGADSVVTEDNLKLTADMADDATKHADFLVLLAAAPTKTIGDLADDLSSVTVYTLNPDGATFSAQNIPIAS
jgi:hypothetical protein